MPEIKGDYQGRLKTIKCNADAKLETVSAIEAGSAIIGNIDRVATVGQTNMYIEQDGTWQQLEGTAHGAYTVPKAERLGTFYNLRANRDRDLVTAPGWTGSRRVKLLTDDDWRLKLATLGTVEHVKDIGHLGTIGDITHLGSIGNVNRIESLGTIGDINHLGSIANTSFDQGVVSDHERHMHIKQYGTWQFLQGTSNCAYVEALVEHNGALVNLEVGNMGGLITAPGWDGALHVPLQTDDYRRLEAAPATSRKGGKKLVTNMGTAVALVASSTPCISVIVKALHSNAGEVYVGDNTVGSATGYPLQKDEFVSFSCDNVNGVYIDRNAGTQGVSFLYVNY